MARRRRVYPVRDKETSKRFSKLPTFSPTAGHSFRVYPEEDVPRKFDKFPTFFPPSHTFRVNYDEDIPQQCDEPSSFSSPNQILRTTPFGGDTSRKLDELPSFISSPTVRKGSPFGDTMRYELSNFSPAKEKLKVSPSNDMGPDISILPSNPTTMQTREIIKQTFNL